MMFAPAFNTIDLQEEMYAAVSGMTFPAARTLVAMGVAQRVVAEMTGAGIVGRLRVRESGSRWEPDEGGAWRLIVPVLDHRDDGGLRMLPDIVDLIALSSSDPDAWTLRTGDGFLLGMGWLDRAREAADSIAEARSWGVQPDPAIRPLATVRLHARPLDLLRADGAGICVLDWGRAALTELRLLGPEVTLITDSDAAARKLTELMQWGGLPEVRAERGEGRLAA